MKKRNIFLFALVLVLFAPALFLLTACDEVDKIIDKDKPLTVELAESIFSHYDKATNTFNFVYGDFSGLNFSKDVRVYKNFEDGTQEILLYNGEDVDERYVVELPEDFVLNDENFYDAKTYVLTFKYADESYNFSKEIKLCISPKVIKNPKLKTDKFFYNGREIDVLTNENIKNLSSEVSICPTSTTKATEIGSYEIFYALKNSNYKFEENKNNLTWSITNAPVEKPVVKESTTTFEYDYDFENNTEVARGVTLKFAAVEDVDKFDISCEGASITTSGDEVFVGSTKVGKYNIVVRLKNGFSFDDFTGNTYETSFEIAKKKLSKPTLAKSEYVCNLDGSAVTLAWANNSFDENTMKIDDATDLVSVTSLSNDIDAVITSRTILINLKNSENYQWADGTESASVEIKILRQSFTISNDTKLIFETDYTDEHKTIKETLGDVESFEDFIKNDKLVTKDILQNLYNSLTDKTEYSNLTKLLWIESADKADFKDIVLSDVGRYTTDDNKILQIKFTPNSKLFDSNIIEVEVVVNKMKIDLSGASWAIDDAAAQNDANVSLASAERNVVALGLEKLSSVEYFTYYSKTAFAEDFDRTDATAAVSNLAAGYYKTFCIAKFDFSKIEISNLAANMFLQDINGETCVVFVLDWKVAASIINSNLIVWECQMAATSFDCAELKNLENASINCFDKYTVSYVHKNSSGKVIDATSGSLNVGTYKTIATFMILDDSYSFENGEKTFVVEKTWKVVDKFWSSMISVGDDENLIDIDMLERATYVAVGTKLNLNVKNGYSVSVNNEEVSSEIVFGEEYLDQDVTICISKIDANNNYCDVYEKSLHCVDLSAGCFDIFKQNGTAISALENGAQISANSGDSFEFVLKDFYKFKRLSTNNSVDKIELDPNNIGFENKTIYVEICYNQNILYNDLVDLETLSAVLTFTITNA